MERFQPWKRGLYFARFTKEGKKPRPASLPESGAWRKIFRAWSRRFNPSKGKRERSPRPEGRRKTEARVKEVKTILKASGGSRTFQELERSLGLSRSQFSKLLNHLDKRIFEISRRPGRKERREDFES